ncbi:MAG: asparagine synthase C-terminal domain-containing protein [Sphingobium sp.]|jgi:asparagine synthase (glutamine-hydrolysing)|uniref:asparagine synthase-related protein n=1 Tax=Sphingobium sp. JS3065 TaxID=2970925 RepID=UPI002264C009|nr:asparagine synthetase B family protein [Sphingobium sp. JS3065]MCI1272424.1 asparagine synthase C-terminal domain-containing protein [Sphingobium sp.]MCI1756254.1 asparagine synthase C-terminal domain-containing protein [Sphingobium sp.]UZW56661.1 asparagine synthase C-terminal domain-containing protein [Sphingobium sp. JS3065]
MPFQYVILLESESDSRERRSDQLMAGTGLVLTKRTKDYLLFTNAPADVIDLGETGVILGSLFPTFGPPERQRQLDGKEADQITASSVRHLLERYWGSYIALHRGATGHHVLRAPLGTLSCLYVRGHDYVAFASRAKLLVQAGLARGSVDWQALAHYLYLRDLPSPHTALLEFRELLPGTEITISSQTTAIAQLWSPWSYVDSRGDAADPVLDVKVERTIQNCVAAFASQFDNVVATLSGGLDSSVVLACLARSRTNVTALTISTQDPNGDERPYAKCMSQHAQVELLEEFYHLEDIDLGKSVASHLPRPSGRIHEQAYRAAVARIAQSQNVAAIFTGNGGDNIFYNSASVRPIIDRFLLQGIGPSLATMLDVASLTRTSLFRVILETARLVVHDGGKCRWKPTPQLLSEELLAAQAHLPIEHPWLTPNDRLIPGKAGHINMLLRMQHHVEGYSPDLPFTVVNPIAAQPIVELCLAIPSWRACTGGRNRAFIRDAFSTQLPGTILNRTTKAGPDSFILALLDARIEQIRERLSYGHLSRQGILNRTELDEIFRTGRCRDPVYYLRLMALLDTEAWLDQWIAPGVSSLD